MSDAYDVRFSRSARRSLTHTLPENVAAAALEFIAGALAASPYRVGKQLGEPLYPLYSARRGDYRVIFRIIEHEIVIENVSVGHRRNVYRTR